LKGPCQDKKREQQERKIDERRHVDFDSVTFADGFRCRIAALPVLVNFCHSIEVL
jgi:hypothetical protein